MAEPCLAAHRCRDYDHHAQQPADAAGGIPLCRPCLTSAATDIALLAHDWRDLEQLLPKPIGVWSDGQPGHNAEAPIPIRLDVEALQQEIWWLTTAWEEVLRDVGQLSAVPHRRPSPTRCIFAVDTDGQVGGKAQPIRVEHPSAHLWPMRPGPADVVRAVRILAPRVEALARVGEVGMTNYPPCDGPTTITEVSGAQGVLDLAHAHQRARTMLGLTEPVYVLPGHCQARGCGRPMLRVKDGSDTVWCDHCGALMTRDDYDRYGNLFLLPKEAA